MITNSSTNDNIPDPNNSNKSNDNNMEFPYPLSIDEQDDLEKIDYKYDYNEADFERINEEFINEITNFKFENNEF